MKNLLFSILILSFFLLLSTCTNNYAPDQSETILKITLKYPEDILKKNALAHVTAKAKFPSEPNYTYSYFAEKVLNVPNENEVIFNDVKAGEYIIMAHVDSVGYKAEYDTVNVEEFKVNEVEIAIDDYSNGSVEVFVKERFSLHWCEGAVVSLYYSEEDMNNNNPFIVNITDPENPVYPDGKGAYFENVSFNLYWVKATWQTAPGGQVYTGSITIWPFAGSNNVFVVAVAS